VRTAGYAVKVSKAFKVIETLTKRIAPTALSGLKIMRTVLGKTENGFELATEITRSRKINFRSTVDPSWGLTPKHLKKHFFGDSKYALNKIDPKGNPDRWIQAVTDLIQRPVSQTLENGAQEINGLFERADGTGVYQLGVRLWPNKNGTFELITILTKQNK
jgi:hypothetical protein